MCPGNFNRTIQFNKCNAGELCSGIGNGRVLNLELYTHRSFVFYVFNKCMNFGLIHIVYWSNLILQTSSMRRLGYLLQLFLFSSELQYKMSLKGVK